MANSIFVNPDTDAGSPSTSIIPTVDNTFDLGSSTFEWRTIYIGTSAVFADAATINWSDIVLSRASANLLQLATGDSFQTVNGTIAANRTALATTSTDGLIAANTTAATGAATVQMSPRLKLRGNAWNTSATQTVDFFLENLPATAATPTGTFKIGYSLNGGAATYPMSLSSVGQFLSLDGTTALPTYSFAADPGNGWLRTGGNQIAWAAASENRFAIVGNAIQAASGGSFNWASTSNAVTTADLTLVRIAANILGLQTGANLQTLRVYDASGTGYTAYAGTGLTTYRNVVTAGWGTPAIYAAGRVTAQSAANASIATYTVGAADGSFEISANMNVTASTTLVTTLTCTYTDEASAARTMVMPVTQLSGSFIAAGAITGTGAWETPVMHIRCKAATAITILTSAGTFTGVTYSAEGIIKQIA